MRSRRVRITLLALTLVLGAFVLLPTKPATATDLHPASAESYLNIDNVMGAVKRSLSPYTTSARRGPTCTSIRPACR